MNGCSRRRFLKVLGVGLGAQALGPVARSDAAPEGVRRLLIITTQHGTVYDQWKMRVGGPLDPMAKEQEDWEHGMAGLEPSQMSPILAPLYDLREKMLVLDGLSMTSAICDSPGDNHGGGRFHSLTGAQRFVYGEDPAALPWEGMSVDVRIAERVVRPGRYRSLHLTDSGKAIDDGIFSRERGGNRIPYEGAPLDIHDRLFGSLQVDAPGSARARLRARRGETMDFLKQQYVEQIGAVDRTDRFKLTQHLTFLDALATRLEGDTGVVCNRPDAPAPSLVDKVARHAALAPIIAAAFACDLTQVITLNIDEWSAEALGKPGHELHEDFAHKDSVEAKAVMTSYGIENAKLIAQLCATLDSVSDGSATLLDNTLVVWTGELANGWHHLTPAPYVLIGGGRQMVNTGRYVHYASSRSLPNDVTYFGQNKVGPAHNHLLVSLCHAMGQSDIEWVGQPSLAGVLDVSGPLPSIAQTA